MCSSSTCRAEPDVEMVTSIFRGQQNMHRIKACTRCGKFHDRDILGAADILQVYYSLLRLGHEFHPFRKKFAKRFNLEYPESKKGVKPKAPCGVARLVNRQEARECGGGLWCYRLIARYPLLYAFPFCTAINLVRPCLPV